MELGGYIILAVLVIVLGFLLYSSLTSSKSGTYVVIPGSVPGQTEQTYGMSLPRSFNQPNGAVYSYTGWLLINDFMYGYGNKRKIFSKGANGPSIHLDTTSNALIVGIPTYGSIETVLIPNIPALKWIHFGLVVDQTSVDIYINGTLRQHHSLAQLPDMNDDVVTAGGGWDGVLGELVYYPKKLTSKDIYELANKKPPSDLKRPTSGPQYFDMTWYIGRLNSS